VDKESVKFVKKNGAGRTVVANHLMSRIPENFTLFRVGAVEFSL
jgi:hypothetical protein